MYLGWDYPMFILAATFVIYNNENEPWFHLFKEERKEEARERKRRSETKKK
jgi:hypothetical protein